MRRILAALMLLLLAVVMVAHPTAAQTNQTTYIVQPGDDLYRIGLKFNIRADVLAQANGIVNPNLVYVGQKLIIPLNPAALTLTPAAGIAMTSAATSDSNGTAPAAIAPLEGTEAGTAVETATAVATIALDNATTYTVQTGDTLYRIAVKFNTTSFIMAQLNNIPNSNLIFVGEILRIPGRAPALPTATPTNTAAPSNTPTPAPLVTIITNTAPPSLTATPAPLVTIITNTPPPLSPTLPGTESAVTLEANSANPTVPTIAVPSMAFVIVTNTPPSTALSPATSVPIGTPTNMASNVGFAYGIVAGLSPNLNVGALATSVSDLGMSWVKVSISWKDYETTKGQIDFTTLDNALTPLLGTKTSVLLSVSRAPDWARTTNAEDGPPTDNTDFANFMGSLAAHYKGKVAAYEVWNNPNIRREWNGKPLSAASYVELLRVAYTAIKNVDPAALVISAGLAPTGFNDNINAIADRSFLQQAITAGLALYADAIGVHADGWANPPDSSCCTASPGVSGWYNDRTFYFNDTLNDYRHIMIQNSIDSKFMWITEFGWGASEGVAASSAVNPNFGYVNFVSQAEQAQYDMRGFAIGQALGYVGPMFLSNLNFCQIVPNDPASSTFEPCYSALLDVNAAPRPAYTAIKGISK